MLERRRGTTRHARHQKTITLQQSCQGLSLFGIESKALERKIFLACRSWPKEYIQSKKIDLDLNYGHDFLCATTAEEMQRTKKPLYIAFSDLTKALDLVSREGLFTISLKIGFAPSLFNTTNSFSRQQEINFPSWW